MMYKKINLFLFSVLLIILFFTIPYYNNWLYNKVLNEPFADDIHHMNIMDRNLKRFGYAYSVFADVGEMLGKFNNVVVLLPPNGYVKTKMPEGLAIPEPAVFYYFTGIRSVWVTSPDVKRANWALIVRGYGDVVVKKMSAIPNSDSLIDVYKQYPQ